MATPGRTAACRRPSTLPKMLAELRVLASSRASPNLDPRRRRRWLPRPRTLRCCSCWSRCCSCCCYCSCCCWCGSAVLLLRWFLRVDIGTTNAGSPHPRQTQHARSIQGRLITNAPKERRMLRIKVKQVTPRKPSACCPRVTAELSLWWRPSSDLHA